MAGQPTRATTVDTIAFYAFGKVAVYHPEKEPNAFVLFISGDGGWNKGVDEMASHIVSQGAMVAGINLVHYFKSLKTLKSACYYPAGDLEELSLTLQKKYKFPQYLKPILVGYSSGATLAYGVLAQSPANTFKGAISLGFCPDIEIDRPLCKGSGLSSHELKKGQSFYLDVCPKLTAPFIALNGSIDQVCNYNDTRKFIESMPMAEMVSLSNVGHGFAVTRNWLPQFLEAYHKVQAEPDYFKKLAETNELLQKQSEMLLKSDLPLTLLPTKEDLDLPLIFFISGDGGWTSFDQSISENLSKNGMAVIGLDAQKYFWTAKTPEKAASDFSGAISYYMNLWNKRSVVVTGYSFGACVAPFIANQLAAPVKEALKGIYCFSPDMNGDFGIHLSDMLRIRNGGQYNIPEGIRQVTAFRPVCVFGNDEDEQTVAEFSKAGARIEKLSGNHHYDNDFNAVSEIILKDFLPAK
jgi:type IV secretory pathway VirJ component